MSRIDMPFPYRKNPFYETVSVAMSRAMIQRGLIARHHREYHRGFNLLNAFFFPTVTAATLLRLSQIIDFFFLCDDVYDTTYENGTDVALVEELLTTNVDILRRGCPPRRMDPLNRLALHLHRELPRLMSSRQVTRLTDSISDYLLRGSLGLMKIWAAGHVPRPEEYVALRQFDVAMYATIDVSEVASRVDIPPEVHTHEIIRRMRRACCLQVALANDVLSYHKEVIRDGCPCNMVHVVATDRNVTLEQAVLQVIDLVNACLREFLELEQMLPSWQPDVDAEVTRYVEGMKHLMGGNWYWSFESTRYNSADSPFLELRTTAAHLHDKSRGLLAARYGRGRA